MHRDRLLLSGRLTRLDLDCDCDRRQIGTTKNAQLSPEQTALPIPAILAFPTAFLEYTLGIRSLAVIHFIPQSYLDFVPLSDNLLAGDSHKTSPLMTGLKLFKDAIEKHRENKDINLKYKTPLTSEQKLRRRLDLS